MWNAENFRATDQISTLRRLLEKKLEFQIDTHDHDPFIDFKCAFDSIERSALFISVILRLWGVHLSWHFDKFPNNTLEESCKGKVITYYIRGCSASLFNILKMTAQPPDIFMLLECQAKGFRKNFLLLNRIAIYFIYTYIIVSTTNWSLQYR